MMKNNELRLFNKVDTENGEATIQLVDTVNVEVYYGKYVDENCKVISLKHIDPIPLTEEWLLKFGAKMFFYMSSKKCQFMVAGIPIVLVVKSDNPNEYILSFEINDKARIDIKYVHQLQNLYFALTGEELTIK